MKVGSVVQVIHRKVAFAALGATVTEAARSYAGFAA